MVCLLWGAEQEKAGFLDEAVSELPLPTPCLLMGGRSSHDMELWQGSLDLGHLGFACLPVW